jgi:hypothetical protein
MGEKRLAQRLDLYHLDGERVELEMTSFPGPGRLGLDAQVGPDSLEFDTLTEAREFVAKWAAEVLKMTRQLDALLKFVQTKGGKTTND